MDNISSKTPTAKSSTGGDCGVSGDGDGCTPVTEPAPPLLSTSAMSSPSGNTADSAERASEARRQSPTPRQDDTPGAEAADASPSESAADASPSEAAADASPSEAAADASPSESVADASPSEAVDASPSEAAADVSPSESADASPSEAADASPSEAADVSPSELAEGASEPMEEDSGSEDDRRGPVGIEPASENEADAGLDDYSQSSSTSHDDESDMEGDETALAAALEDMKKKADDILKKPKPKHTWSLVKELHKRQLGDRPSLLHQDKFRLRMYSSLHAVERLELMDKLCFHEGCVNCLNFNASGDLLASGSDDLNVVVWDWQRQRKAYYYNSGHKSNIFEAKFMPLRDDTHIVSTSRDGQVRLAEISPAGECRSIRRLAQHRGSGRKLTVPAHSAHTVLSCGEDAVVFSIDLRQRQSERLTTCIDNGKKVPTNSIACHPDDDNVFLLSCIDKYVRVYDRRMIGTENQAYRRLCPHRLLDDGKGRYSVTCAVFNYNGSEIVASYNDEDIFLFDATHSDGADAVHQYSGHRNNDTIKGVNFYGPTSQYVVSGSDCGNIFFWDKDTEAIVQCMPGDEKGVVNCLEPHPHIPVLATSGLDDDVKLWITSRDKPPDFTSLRETVERNLQERVEETPSADSLGGSLMWTLMQQVFGSQRRRHQLFSAESDELDTRSTDDSGEEEDGPGDCRPT